MAIGQAQVEQDESGQLRPDSGAGLRRRAGFTNRITRILEKQPHRFPQQRVILHEEDRWPGIHVREPRCTELEMRWYVDA
jgi:hypothetical protein